MASVLLFAAAGPVRADEVKLTTALEVGKQISLSVNPGLKLTLTWGDGQTETLTASGTLQNLTVKHTDLTISTTEGSLTALYLQGNALTPCRQAIDSSAGQSIPIGNKASSLTASAARDRRTSLNKACSL